MVYQYPPIIITRTQLAKMHDLNRSPIQFFFSSKLTTFQQFKLPLAVGGSQVKDTFVMKSDSLNTCGTLDGGILSHI